MSMEKHDPNAHIREYINYYREIDTDGGPGYAVMVTGHWGVGKTHLIRDIVNAHKHIWVSLYGLSKTSQIDYEIFKALHPILTNPKMRLLGKVGKSFCKLGLRIDLDEDNRPDANVTVQAPDINLKDLEAIQDKSGFLIFDDLERSNFAKPEEILGYINNLVELLGLKVVIIGNENELYTSNEEVRIRYNTTREKLIGTTLKVEPNINAALSSILYSLSDDRYSFLMRNLNRIENFCRCEEGINFRILKQSLLNFCRIYEHLDEHHKDNEVGISVFLYLFLLISYSWKTNRISMESILKMSDAISIELMSDQTKAKPITEIFERHSMNVMEENMNLSGSLWSSLVCEGKLSASELNRQISQTLHFLDPSNPTEPAWIVVAQGLFQDEQVFYESVEKLESQITEREFTKTIEILHIVGISLWLRDDVFLADVNECKHEIWKTIAEGWSQYFDKLQNGADFEISLEEYRGCGDLNSDLIAKTPWKYETPEFGKIHAQYTKFISQSFENNWKKISTELIVEMPNDHSKFYRSVCLTNHVGDSYFDIPILSKLKPQEFVSALLSVHANELQNAMMFFKNRYKKNYLQDLIDERNWFHDVSKILDEEVTKRVGIQKLQLKTAIERYVEPAKEAWKKMESAN